MIGSSSTFITLFIVVVPQALIKLALRYFEWVDEKANTNKVRFDRIVFRFSEPEAYSPHPARFTLDGPKKCATIGITRAFRIDCF